MNLVRDKEGYIDIIKSSKHHFSSEALKNYLAKDKISKEIYKLFLCSLTLASTSNLNFFDFPKPIIYAIIGKTFLDLGIESFPKGLYEHEIQQLILETEQYAECSEQYKQYVKNIAEFYKSLNKKSALEISTFFDENLKFGLFNEDLSPQTYKTFNYSKDVYIDRISGSTVMTGTSICRHNAPFLTDILTASRIKACNLPVEFHDSLESLHELDNPKEHLKELDANHMLTGIIENNENFAYDPTNHVAGFLNDSKIINNISGNHLIAAYQNSEDAFAFLIDYEKDNIFESYNFSSNLSIKEFKDYKPKRIDKCYLKYLKMEAQIEMILRKKELRDFHQENKKTIQKIKHLNETLAPRADKEITNWKVK